MAVLPKRRLLSGLLLLVVLVMFFTDNLHG